jgi:FAD/FMN-containing dehydrogenase
MEVKMPSPPIGTSHATRGDTLASALRASFGGQVIDRQDPEYDRARSVWNGLIERRPAAIARCTSTADVVNAVRLARERRPVVSIRGGGHQVAGSAVCEDGLVIDLSGMKQIDIDVPARTARVQAGVLWGELDRETQRFGLATPGGEVSLTGVAGLTLGGGMGVLMRAHGLSCDNVRALEMVTADGQVRHVNAHEHADLFWAARGAGRGLGVVTWFEFDLHPLGPDVEAAMLLYPYEEADQVLKAWPEVVRAVPDSVTPELALWSVLPDPTVPAEMHGQKVVLVTGVHAGPPEDADTALAPLRRISRPLLDQSGTLPYLAVQSAVDAVFPDGGRYYMKSHFMDAIDPQAIRTLLEWDARRPTPESLVVLRTMGGAVNRLAGDETAFAHRAARFNLSIDAGWTDPGLDEAAIGWARGAWDALRPFSTGGVYVNFAGLSDEDDDQQRAVLGPHAARLAEVRAKYDPEGVFAEAARQP